MGVDMLRRSGVLAALLISMIFFGASGLGFGQAVGLPPAEGGAKDRLLTSPRHGEWAHVAAGAGDIVDAWVVYPERSDKAPAVIVIHENVGLSDWVRSVADQLAAEGFIAVAPDLLTGKAPGGKGSSAVDGDAARQLIYGLQGPEIVRRLNAVASYSAALPAATGEYAVVGFCWGGGISFSYATQQPALKAAIVCYGTPPDEQAIGRIKAPVLGLYGGSDARVTSTVPAADALMKKLGKRYEYEIFDGASHAFFRAQDGQSGANLNATQKGWPRMVQFLKQSFSTGVSSIRTSGWASLASADMSSRGEALAMLPITCGH
jgi:carboxymethylenebutenolidase